MTDFDTAAEAAALVGDEELKARVEFFASHQDSASGKSLQDLPYFALSAGAFVYPAETAKFLGTNTGTWGHINARLGWYIYFRRRSVR